MGSLNASGIPVVTKLPTSLRKHDIRIKSTDNRTDVVSVVTANRPSLTRAIGSGSIVRDDGSVEYTQELVVGVIRMARTCQERIASDTGCLRAPIVDLAGNITQVVIPTGLVPTTPQKGAVHTGERIVRRDSTDDSLIDRVASTGPFDPS